MIPVKKLSEAFDNCAKVEGGMKVYLRIRPMPSKDSHESTITVESGKELFFLSYILLMSHESIFLISLTCQKI
jgi:hypothetical protein